MKQEKQKGKDVQLLISSIMLCKVNKTKNIFILLVIEGWLCSSEYGTISPVAQQQK